MSPRDPELIVKNWVPETNVIIEQGVVLVRPLISAYYT